MIGLENLGFVIRKLIQIHMGLTLPTTTPSQEISNSFETTLAERGVAMCNHAALLTLLTFATNNSPDPTTTAAITQIDTDLNLPTPPA